MFRKLFIILFLAGIPFLVGCDDTSTSQTGTVPVYQGMELSGDNIIEASSNEGPIMDRLAYIGLLLETSEPVTTEPNLVAEEQLQYFAGAGENLYLRAIIYNPDEYEILSFTLNGLKYQSYMFEDGSDSEYLILEVNSGDVEGVKEFTIDQIKYVDGTEIKDVVIAGEQTISLGVTYTDEPDVSLAGETETTNQIQLTANVDDTNGLLGVEGAYCKILLYQDDDQIAEQELEAGSNQVIFENLSSRTDYSYQIVMKYDLLDGQGLLERTKVSRLAITEGYIDFGAIIPSQEGVEFALEVNDPDGYGAITSIKLFSDEHLISELSNLETREFINLLSDTAYRIYVTYTYDLGDEQGSREETIFCYVSTLAKTLPTIELTNIIATYNTITFNIVINDPDETGYLSYVEIHGPYDIIATESTEIRFFTGLLSDTDYEIWVGYQYDLDDGDGIDTVSIHQDVHTIAYQLPELSIDNLTSTQDSLGFTISIFDPDNRGELTSIQLYAGDILVATTESLEQREFTGLSVNSLYTVRAIYTFDMNDGEGGQELIVNVDYPTLALEINVDGIFVLNTVVPEVGDEVHLQIFFTNPSSIVIHSFCINDQEISVVGSGVISQAVVVFIPDTEGGVFTINVTEVTYEIFGIQISQPILSSYSEDILIVGEFSVLGIYNDFNNFVASDQDNYIIIELNNPTGFTVTEITLRYYDMFDYTYTEVQVEQIDDSHIRVLWKGFETAWVANVAPVSVIDITYTIEGVDPVSKNISNISNRFMIFYSFVPRYVTTIAELQNMDKGYIYLLSNSLDFTGKHWEPYEFYGVLDGNGFSIINLSVVESYEPEYMGTTFAGMFSKFSGMVRNIEFRNIYMSFESTLDLAAGGLIGNTQFAVLQNIVITGTVVGSVSSDQYCFVGGLIGMAYGTVRVENNFVHLNVISESNVTYFLRGAGYIGFAPDANLYFSSNVFGGSVNINFNEELYVASEGIANGFIGSNLNSGFVHEIENNYYTDDARLMMNGTEVYDSEALIAAVSELNDLDFYTEILNWSNSIWGLDDLNYLAGHYPYLVDGCSMP